MPVFGSRGNDGEVVTRRIARRRMRVPAQDEKPSSGVGFRQFNEGEPEWNVAKIREVFRVRWLSIVHAALRENGGTCVAISTL